MDTDVGTGVNLEKETNMASRGLEAIFGFFLQIYRCFPTAAGLPVFPKISAALGERLNVRV